MFVFAFLFIQVNQSSVMNCEDCNKGIEGTYFEVNGGKPVCGKCYEVKNNKNTF